MDNDVHAKFQESVLGMPMPTWGNVPSETPSAAASNETPPPTLSPPAAAAAAPEAREKKEANPAPSPSSLPPSVPLPPPPAAAASSSSSASSSTATPSSPPDTATPPPQEDDGAPPILTSEGTMMPAPPAALSAHAPAVATASPPAPSPPHTTAAAAPPLLSATEPSPVLRGPPKAMASPNTASPPKVPPLPLSTTTVRASTTNNNAKAATARTLFTSRARSKVSVIEEQWLKLCDYFQRVQCANTDDERHVLVRELSTVEDSLNAILAALLSDRKLLFPSQRAPGRLPLSMDSFPTESGGGGTCVAPAGVNGFEQDTWRPPFSGAGDWSGAGTFASPRAFPASGFLLDGALSSLPPCYRFLFADPHHDTSADVSSAASSAASSPHGAAAVVPADGHANQLCDDVSPIGGVFLLTLCQYAKQDEPQGVRSVILEFLVRLLQEADLPMDRAAYPAGDPVLSLLQLNPPLLIVPLLDMLRKVSKALDPSAAAAQKRASLSRAPSTSAAADPSGVDPEDRQDGTFLQDAGRTQLVIFLGSLAEKMERVPALANFFVVEDGAQGDRSLFVLLEVLLPYITHDCSAPGWTHRRDTCRYALSAVVSLAKCPDPWIQDLVGAERRVASRTLNAARTTLVTLCKIPDNDDSATQLLFLRDVVRFWATLLAMSPSVAEDLQLASLIEKEFIYQTLIPLLQSADAHVYSAACVAASTMLDELSGSTSPLTLCLARALLATTIRKSSGRVILGTYYYESVVMHDAEFGNGPGTGAATQGTEAVSRGELEERASAALMEHPTTSFFAYYILPHLSSNPFLSEDEREMSEFLGYATTRWSATKATLLLVQTLAESVPDMFLREAFLMDVASLADVQRKQRQQQQQQSGGMDKNQENAFLAAAAATNASPHPEGNGDDSDGGVGRMSLGLWSMPGAPPHLHVHDYFVTELRAAALTSPALGLQSDVVGEAVLSRLMRIEGNMQMTTQKARQQVMASMARQASLDGADTKPNASSPFFVNCWSHAGVRTSPLTVALCEMVQHLDATPFTVSAIVADVVVSLCLLPDVRVLYTLLDAAHGPLTLALCRLRDVLGHKLSAASAEASPVDPAKAQPGKDRVRGGNAPADASKVSAAITAPSAVANTPLPVLYETLLQHWDVLAGDHYAQENSRMSTAAMQSVADTDAPSAAVRAAIDANSNVLHACLYAEYLHAHLDAVIDYAALSQNLMYLQTSC